MCSIKAKAFQKKKKDDAKIPYIWKNHVIVDNQTYKISDGQIRIPIRPKQYIQFKLTDYVIQQIKNNKLGSITITEDKLIISYSKGIPEQKTSDFVAVDRNLDNATAFDTQNKFTVYDLQKTNQIKQTYKQIKSKFKRNDARIKKKIFSKYGKRERNRVHDILHKTSKQIIHPNKLYIQTNYTSKHGHNP